MLVEDYIGRLCSIIFRVPKRAKGYKGII